MLRRKFSLFLAQKKTQSLREKELQNFKFVNALCFDGRKDASQMIVQGPNNKHYQSVQLEEHYTVNGEPGTYYLTHFVPKDGKGQTIAKKLFDLFKNKELEHKLDIVGTDGTASITGKYKGCIRGLEELSNKPLQWIVCLLHSNKRPVRHVFGVLDGSTSSPETETIGKKIAWVCVKLDNYSILAIVSAFFVFSYSSGACC